MSALGQGAFPRIPPDHPLTVAARYANAYAEEQGLEATVKWASIVDIGVGELAYLAEQRAYRAVAALLGFSLGTSGEQGTFGTDEAIVAKIRTTPLWQQMGPLLLACYMDGLVIGWVGRGLHEEAKEHEASD